MNVSYSVAFVVNMTMVVGILIVNENSLNLCRINAKCILYLPHE